MINITDWISQKSQVGDTILVTDNNLYEPIFAIIHKIEIYNHHAMVWYKHEMEYEDDYGSNVKVVISSMRSLFPEQYDKDTTIIKFRFIKMDDDLLKLAMMHRLLL